MLQATNQEYFLETMWKYWMFDHHGHRNSENVVTEKYPSALKNEVLTCSCLNHQWMECFQKHLRSLNLSHE